MVVRSCDLKALTKDSPVLCKRKLTCLVLDSNGMSGERREKTEAPKRKKKVNVPAFKTN